MAPTIQIEGLTELRSAVERLQPALAESLTKALADSGRIVAERAAATAPRRSGRMAASIQPFMQGPDVGGVEVTARRVSRRWPGGFLYPARIERSEPFLAPAVTHEKDRVMERMGKVLDDIARAWAA